MDSSIDLKRMITISLFYNATEYSIRITRDKTIYDLINRIIDKLNVNIAMYELIYDNAPVTISDKIRIYSLVGDNEKPSFMLKRKIIELPDKKLNKDRMLVIINNFPSFRDMSDQINYFFESAEIENTEYQVEFKASSCKVYIKNRELAFAFVQFLNSLKYTNDLYYRMNMKIQLPDEYGLLYYYQYSNKYLPKKTEKTENSVNMVSRTPIPLRKNVSFYINFI